MTKGNAAYQAGMFAEARDAYVKAIRAEPELPELWFNLGDARYRAGDFAGAAVAFKQAVRKGKTPVALSRAQHNLGNCHIREAEQQRESNLENAIVACEQSIESFEMALRLDPGFGDAAENLKIARAYLESLREEAKQREEGKQNQTEQRLTEMQPPSRSAHPGALGATQSALSGQSPSGAQASRSSPAMAQSNPSHSSAEQMAQQFLERQRAFQEALQNQFRSSGSAQNQWSQSHSFTFQFGSSFGQNPSLSRPRPAEPVNNQPQAIFDEEKENRRQRDQFSTRAAGQTAEKDW